MIISVVHLWNSAQRSLPWRTTFVPLVATDSAVLANVVTTVPVSLIVILLPISVCLCVCVCGGGGGRYVGERLWVWMGAKACLGVDTNVLII